MQLDPQQLLSIWLKEREIQNQSKHTLQAYERRKKLNNRA